MYWNITIQTNKTIGSNRPITTYFDEVNIVAYFIDFALPNDLTKKEQRKI